MADDLERARSQVGRFFYLFGQLESQINVALARLLDLSENAGIWVSRNIALSRRLDFVSVVALDLIKDQKERADAEKIFAEVAQHNSDRDVLAHSKFEPFKGGVK